MTLSVCMIVRDEVHQLSEILKQCQSFADEIVIVDTGSVDNTKEVARKFTDKVFDFPWCDNFSAARNYANSKATGDYILPLDADDRVNKENQSLICQLKEHFDGKTAFHFQIHTEYNCGKVNIYPQIRCYPNRQDVYFRDAVHEEILTSIYDARLKVKQSNIRIVHVGYIDKQILGEKKARNLIMLKRALKDKPLDAKLNYYLGRHSEETKAYHAANKYYQAALPYMESIADKKPLFLFELLAGLVRVTHELGKFDFMKEHFDSLCAYSKDLPPENTIGVCMLAEEVGIYDRMYAGHSHSC